MPIDLYSMRLSPPCRAVLMTIKQLNIDVNLKTVDLSEGEQYKPEFLKLNPAHKVPVIDDDGFVLDESKAIMQYLCNRYAPDSTLYPKDPKKRAIVDRWLYIDTTLLAQQREAVFMTLFTGAQAPEDKVKAFKDTLKLVDTLIGDNNYLSGDHLTIADFAILSTCVGLDGKGFSSAADLLLTDDYPNAKRWLERLRTELPFYEEINDFDAEFIKEYAEKIKNRLMQAAQAK